MRTWHIDLPIGFIIDLMNATSLPMQTTATEVWDLKKNRNCGLCFCFSDWTFLNDIYV